MGRFHPREITLTENDLKQKRDEMLNVSGGDESYVRRIIESDIVFVR